MHTCAWLSGTVELSASLLLVPAVLSSGAALLASACSPFCFTPSSGGDTAELSWLFGRGGGHKKTGLYMNE